MSNTSGRRPPASASVNLFEFKQLQDNSTGPGHFSAVILLRYNSAVKAQDTTSSIVYSFPLRFELFDKESDCLKFWCVLHVKCARLQDL